MKPKLLIALLALNYQYLVVGIIALALLASGAIISDVIEAVLMLFFFMSGLKLLGLRPLVEKFSAEHHEIMKNLEKKFEMILVTWAPLSAVATALVLQLWGSGKIEVWIAVTWLFSLVLTIQMVSWRQILSDIRSRGNLGISAIVVSFPLSALVGYISALLMLAAGVPRLLDFAIVFGVPSVSFWLLHSLISYYSIIKPEEIVFTKDLQAKLNKLRELKVKCINLQPVMFAQQLIPPNANVTPIAALKGEKCYFGIVKGEQVDFLDANEKTVVKDNELLSKLKFALNLKNKLSEISKIKQKSQGSVYRFFVYPKLLLRCQERAMKGYIKFDELSIPAHREEIEKEMFRSDFEMFVERDTLDVKASRVRNILSALDEMLSIDLAIELCKEVRGLDESLKKFAETLKKREKLWKEYTEKTRLKYVMPGVEDAIKEVNETIKWVEQILDTCETDKIDKSEMEPSSHLEGIKKS
jgi:hypothetical protein